MSDHFFQIGNSRGIISLANIYYYKGYYFENHSYLGPMRVKKKDFEPCKNYLGRKFLKIYENWLKLTDKEKEKTRIYG